MSTGRTDHHRERDREYRHRIHAEALAAYGDGTCACCGAAENLSLDHIDGNGADHREQLFGNRRKGGYRFYLWLRKNGYPPGYQVLCRPCNHSKAKTGRCQLVHDATAGDVKRCSHPGHEGPNPIPRDLFYRKATSPDGCTTWCRACVKRDDPVRRPRKTGKRWRTSAMTT